MIVFRDSNNPQTEMSQDKDESSEKSVRRLQKRTNLEWKIFFNKIEQYESKNLYPRNGSWSEQRNARF